MKRPLVVGLLAAELFTLLHPEMWGIGGESKFPSWDVTRVFWADIAHARRALATGELPLWNAFDRAGYSFVAEPQSGFFDPVMWILVLIALIIGSAPAWLITLKSLLYYAIAASGMDAYLRERKLPPWAVAMGTVVFTFCPRLDKLKDQSALWPTAWAGWLLLAGHRFVVAPSPRRAVILGLAASATVLSGYPPMVFRLALFVAPLLGWWVVATARAHPRPKEYWRDFGIGFGITALVVLGLCSAQIQATLSVLSITERAALSLSEVVATRVKPEFWVGIVGVLPSTSALMVYGGLASAIGIVLALWRTRRIEVYVVAVLGVLGFILACGHSTPVLMTLATFPGFRSFRIAAHYLLLSSLATALLSAYGLGCLSDIDRKRGKIAVVLAVGVTGLAWLATPEPTLARFAVWVAVLGCVSAVSLVRGRWQSRAGWALVLVTVVDLGLAARPISKLLRPHPDPERAEILEDLVDEPDLYRVADFAWVDNRVGPRRGVRDLIGHRPALTDRRYRVVYEAAPDSAALLQAMNVGLAAFPRRTRATRNRSLQRIDGQRQLYRVENPWPLAFFTSDVEIVKGYKESLARMQAGEGPTVSIERRHVPGHLRKQLDALESDDPPLAPALLETRTNRLAFEVDAPQAGILVVNESYDPGWRVFVDDEPAWLLRANLIHRAVLVPAGTHRIDFRYRPRGLGWLLLLFAATLLGCLGWLSQQWLATRRVSPKK